MHNFLIHRCIKERCKYQENKITIRCLHISWHTCRYVTAENYSSKNALDIRIEEQIPANNEKQILKEGDVSLVFSPASFCLWTDCIVFTHAAHTSQVSASHPWDLVQVWEQSTLQELNTEPALSARLNITPSPFRSSLLFLKTFDSFNNYTKSIFVISILVISKNRNLRK